MNVFQFLERWPKKEGRLFMFAGGKDHDRLPIYYTVVDRWRDKVDRMDFVRLQNPTPTQLAEACRMDPVVSPYRVVAATEMEWHGPTEDGGEPKSRGHDSLNNVIQNLPRDLVLIMSTAADSPNTKNDLAQNIIKKGYWVVLTQPNLETAASLCQRLTQWENPEHVHEVVETVGTSPALLLNFLRTSHMTFGPGFTIDNARELLVASPTGTTFDLVEAILSKDTSKALSLTQSPDVSTGKLIGALDRKLSSLVTFMGELKKGRSPKDALIHMRLPGFLAHGLFEASKRWTPGEVVMAWQYLAEAGTHADKPGTNDLLVTRLCGARGA